MTKSDDELTMRVLADAAGITEESLRYLVVDLEQMLLAEGWKMIREHRRGHWNRGSKRAEVS